MDAVLRAATSIVNSGKLKKLFKVILFSPRPVKAHCFLLQNKTDGFHWFYLRHNSYIIPFLGGSGSNTVL